MAEIRDTGQTHQVHGNTPEEKRAAAVTIADTALRVTARRKKSPARARRDMTTALLLLDLIDKERAPEDFDETLLLQQAFARLGQRTQFTTQE